MKKLKLFSAFLVLFTAIGFTACDSEPVDTELLNTDENGVENPGGSTGTPGSFKVNFNGETFTATTVQASVSEALIAVSGLRGTNGEAVSFVVQGTTAGTYNEALIAYTQSGTSEYAYTNINPDLNENPEQNGVVTITNIDTVNNKISGTFSFTGFYSDADANLPSIEFTNGVFTNVSYTPVGNGGQPNPEYLKATIDGTMFDYSNNIIVALSEGETPIISINGITSNNNAIALFIREDITVGNHAITNEIFNVVKAQYSVGDTDFNADSGSMTIISKANGFIKGTFSFTSGGVQVTNGSFNVEYIF